MKKTAIVTGALAAVGFALSLWFWNDVPDPMPVHWNERGEPDGFGSRTFGLLMGPVLTVLMPLFILGITRLDPRKEHVERSSGALETIAIAMGVFFTVIHCVTLQAVLSDDQMLDGSIIIMMVGGLFVVLGNVMPKIKSNHLAGIRTPWTLDNEKVWAKTHRFGGWIFVIAGVGMMALGLLVPAEESFVVMMGLIFGAALAPMIYSWAIHREEAKK